MNWKVKFYFWWRYSNNPIANIFREYNKFKLRRVKRKFTKR